MANSIDPTAAPQYNKYVKKEVVYDLTRGGSGTPWENRGEHGTVSAFVKTAFRSMFSPGMLLDHIRGTTVNDDSKKFLNICIGFWTLSIPVHAAINYFLIDKSKFNVDVYQYCLNTGIFTVIAAAWTWVMFRLIPGLYHKLVITEIKQPVPQTLTFNIVAYTLGGSLLAPIPFVGPPLAAVLMLSSLIVAGRKRLYISWRAAVIDALLVYAAAFGATAVVFFVGSLLWNFVMPPAVEPIIVLKKPL